jgi:hypothetical protein
MDTDDEVRDRATFYVNVLKQQQRALSSAYILNGMFRTNFLTHSQDSWLFIADCFDRESVPEGLLETG